MNCSGCDAQLEDDAPICPVCGSLTAAAEAPPQLPPPPIVPAVPRFRRRFADDAGDERDDDRPSRSIRPRRPEPMHGAAVAAVVLGVVACASACFWPLSLLCGVPGLIFSFVARNTHSRRTAAAGFALNLAALFAATGYMVITIAQLTADDVPRRKIGKPGVPSFFR